MDDVERANKTYKDYKNTYIINMTDTIFNAPLTQNDLEPITSSQTYLFNRRTICNFNTNKKE